jgi:hypothetical protein
MGQYRCGMGMGKLTERIESVEVACEDVARLAATLADLNRLKGWVSVVEARISRRLAELEASGHAPPPADLLARSGNSSKRAAERAARRATVYGNVPSLERQRAKGRVSDEHGDALAAAASKLTDQQCTQLFALDAELARQAAGSTPAQFARHLGRVVDTIAANAARDRSEQQRGLASLSHGLNGDTGMGWLRAELHPDDYQRVKRKLDAEVTAIRQRAEHEGRRPDQIAASAFVDIVTSQRAAASPPPELLMLIDLRSITTGPHASGVSEYVDGTALPLDTARRHACNADIIPVVLGGAGQPLDVGRARRHATRAQRHALRSMYRTCAVGDCERSFDRCEMHHLAEWDRQSGPTDLANLVPICSFHHHRAHEGRWRLQLDPSTRQLDVHLRNGELHSRSLPDMMQDRTRVA